MSSGSLDSIVFALDIELLLTLTLLTCDIDSWSWEGERTPYCRAVVLGGFEFDLTGVLCMA